MNQNGAAILEPVELADTHDFSASRPVATLTAEQQANELLTQLQALGVTFGAVAIAPKTGAQVPLVEFLPDGWRFQVVPMMAKNGNGSDSGLS